MKYILFSLVGLVAFAGVALAGPQYVDKTGFAASGYDVVAYTGLKQVPVGKKQINGIPGKSSITANYNGAKWAFSTRENRDKFLANPAKYVPQFNGHCAYGVSLGGKVPGNPNLWRIVDGKLYFNITRTVVGFWEKDIPGHIKTGGKNWLTLEPTKASTLKVPELVIKNAPL